MHDTVGLLSEYEIATLRTIVCKCAVKCRVNSIKNMIFCWGDRDPRGLCVIGSHLHLTHGLRGLGLTSFLSRPGLEPTIYRPRLHVSRGHGS